jgi:hypothetical protein
MKNLGYIKYAAIIACFAPALAMADTQINQSVYEGSLGNTKITFQILRARSGTSDVAAASYFYNKKRQNINLFPSDEGVGIFSELPVNCTDIDENCKVRAEFRLRVSTIGLIGTWVSKTDNKSYPVDIKLVAQNKYVYKTDIIRASDLLDVSSFHYEDSSNFEKNPYFKRQYYGSVSYSAPKIVNGYKFQTITDKLTKISYVSIESPQKGHDLTNIKRTLSVRHIELVAEGLDCNNSLVDTSDKNTYGYYNEYMSDVIHITDNVLVIREGGSTYCGGAHPNNSLSHHVFDMKSGKELSNKDLFNIFIEKNYSTDKTPQFQKFFDKITVQEKYAYSATSGAPEDLKEACKALFDENYGISIWPDNKGLVFSIDDAPHAIGPCMDDYYRLPFKEMAPFMTPLAKQLFAKELGGK